MKGLDRLLEIETLIETYENTGIEAKLISEEFYFAVRDIVKYGIPIREQTLSVKVPFAKVKNDTIPGKESSTG